MDKGNKYALKFKKIVPLTGNDNYDIWSIKIEVLAKRKGLAEILHFKDNFANALVDGEVSRPGNHQELGFEEYYLGFEEIDGSTGERKRGKDRGCNFHAPQNNRFPIMHRTRDSCIEIAKCDNGKLYDLIVGNVNDRISLRLQAICRKDGIGALKNLDKWYGENEVKNRTNREWYGENKVLNSEIYKFKTKIEGKRWSYQYF